MKIMHRALSLLTILGCLSAAACGDDGRNAADRVALKGCTTKIQAMVQSRARLAGMRGKEAEVCGCMIKVVRDDKSLNETQRSLMLAMFSAKPGSDEEAAALRQANSSFSAGQRRTLGKAVAACGNKFIGK